MDAAISALARTSAVAPTGSLCGAAAPAVMISWLTSSTSALPIRNSTGQGQAIRLYRQEIRNKRLRRSRRTRRDCPSAPSAARLPLLTPPYLHSARSAAPTLLWRPAPPAPLARSTHLGQQRPTGIRHLAARLGSLG